MEMLDLPQLWLSFEELRERSWLASAKDLLIPLPHLDNCLALAAIQQGFHEPLSPDLCSWA